ncbi:patatin [Sphingomonas sp. Root710]|uniref:patatin-like protein n=1 Tax=Sphingomonas sp. Root710 TaxID=1736594 RepID=UPI0007007F54|nr:patatin-like protein [Sphingomonas sp. Root710]KRB81234.1 patatin [Sphingomonas sp. Root710]
MREKELRLALVCYGGVSLAVYMHGISKELWRLARASRAFHDGDPAAPGSEAIYRRLLERIEADHGVKLRVLIDVIAGASAGGMNGLFLGHAISTGQSLEPLTDLWLDRADVDVLLDPDARPLSRFSKLWALPFAWMLARRRGGAVERTVAAETRAEVRRKLSGFVRARWFHPPFGGVTFTNLILDAFDAMAAAPAGPPLLPERQPLDVSVTVTDFHGYNQRLRLHSPAMAEEREHRLTIAFTDRGIDGRALADAAELTFAARATASFPGAFPAFNVAELDKVLKARDRAWPGRETFLDRIFPRAAASGSPEDLVLIDGSVLANAPFRPAIDALRNRPARREVDRRFVYLDPTANIHAPPERTRDGMVRLPGFFTTIFGAMSTIPREQPIRDNLEVIEQRSVRIAQTRRIIDAIRPEVNAAVESAMERQLLLYRPSPERIGAWRTRAHEQAAKRAGFTYAAYGQLKLTTIAEELTSTIALLANIEDAAERHVVRGLIGAHLRSLGFEEPDALSASGTSDALVDFLRQHDLGFRIRRLRFLADRLTEMETGGGGSDEAALQAARDAIYGSLAPFLDLQMRDHYERPVVAAAQHFAEDPETAIAAIGATRNLAALDLATDRAIAAVLPRLSKGDRRTLLLAYLGFSFYDLATLSLMRVQGAQEFHAIQVDRISPDDCGSIRAGGAAATLKGIEFNLFGAFFSRAYRENDYLWGRLHGAERMVDILVSTLPSGETIAAADIVGIKRTLFRAVLDEERGRLKTIPDQIATIEREVSRIGAPSGSAT